MLQGRAVLQGSMVQWREVLGTTAVWCVHLGGRPLPHSMPTPRAVQEQCGCAPEAGPWHGQAQGNLEGPAARWSALQPGGAYCLVHRMGPQIVECSRPSPSFQTDFGAPLQWHQTSSRALHLVKDQVRQI